jgi:hypothetical protein
MHTYLHASKADGLSILSECTPKSLLRGLLGMLSVYFQLRILQWVVIAANKSGTFVAGRFLFLSHRYSFLRIISSF